MKKFNVGDKVLLVKIENKYGDDHSSGYELPMEVRIRAVEDLYDYGVETLDGKWLTSVDEKNLRPLQQEVLKQVIISVQDGTLKVQYTTNTKKNNVSIQRTGSRIGKIKLDEIDSLIGLLTKLKAEV